MMEHNRSTTLYIKDLPDDIDTLLMLVSEHSASCRPRNFVEVFPKISVDLFNNYFMLILRQDQEIRECDCGPETGSTNLRKSLNCPNKCNKCLLLCALTAAKAIFRYNTSITIRDLDTIDMNDDEDVDKKYEIRSFVPDYKISCGAIPDNEIVDKWYKEMSHLMVTNDINNLLIKHLSSSCIFTSFQAKEVILSIIKGKLIAVHPTLDKISEQCTAKSSSVYFNIIKDLLSSKLFSKPVNLEAFEHVQSSAFILTFLTTKFEAANNTFINTHELFEYFTLILKVVKLVMRKNEDFMRYCSYLCHLLKTSVLPYTNRFFLIFLQHKGHIVCSKYLKVVAELLSVVSSSAPECIVDVSQVICSQLLNSFLTASSGGLFSSQTFVSTGRQAEESSTQNSISVLVKLFIEVSFKSCAICLRGNSDQKISSANILYSILLEVQPFISRSKEDGWLPNVFGDQDDKWIISLLCLLIIWKELNKCCKPLDQNHPQNRFDGMEKFLKLICPHQLFFQFAKFISFDHLILADFLTSPETEFLNYFILYLHTVIDNWEHFYKINYDMSGCEAKNFGDQSKFTYENNKDYLEHNCMQKKETASENRNKTSDLKENEVPFIHIVSQNNEIFNQVNFARPARVLVSYSDSESDESNEELDVCSGDQFSLSQCGDESNKELNVFSGDQFSLSLSRSGAQGVELVGNTDREEKCYNIFPNSAEEEAVQVIEMFIRLRLTIERLQSKNLFPYNPKPLLKLLDKIENIFDSFSNKSA